MFRLGVDVGGTLIKAGVIGEDNTIVARVSVPTEADKPYKEVISNIVRGAELAATAPLSAKRWPEPPGAVRMGCC